MSNEEDLYVDGETLIAEVKKRQSLYDPSSSDYNDRVKRAKLWDEVCKQLVMNWDDLVPTERNNINRDIQKRWRSIRDSFLKDYKKRRILGNKAKGKPYMFYRHMSFIVPMIEKRRTIQLENISEELSLNESQASDESYKDVPETPAEKLPVKLIKIGSGGKDPKKTSSDIQQGEEDEDKMFLLSLLPLFKIMEEDIKLTARIKMLEIARQALQTDSFVSVAKFPPRRSAPPKQNIKTFIENPSSSPEKLVSYDAQDSQPVAAAGEMQDSPICFDDVEEPSTEIPSLSDFKSEPNSPQPDIEEHDPLLPAVETGPTIRKRPRSETVMTPRTVSTTPEDVFDAIGKNVAHKLRGMVHQQRIIAEKIISDVMYHGQMETLTLNSHLSLNKDS